LHARFANSFPDHAGFLETRTFGSLDGLRALSIAAVLWHHTTTRAPSGALLERGFLGVDLFFVISGFLIVTLLLRECRRTGDISLSNFYIRRSLRIFPAYAALLLPVALMAYLHPGNSSTELKRELPYALFYLSNLVSLSSMLAITWSLSAEEQFYLVVPGLLTRWPRAFPFVLLPLGYLLACLPPFGWLPTVHMPAFFRETTFCPILLGVMLAYVLDSERGWAFVNRWIGPRSSPLWALSLVVLAVSFPGEDLSGWPRLMIHLSLVLLLASCVVREDHVLQPLLKWAPLRRIGVLSYGFYLYHMLAYWPVSKVLDRLGLPSKYLLFPCVLLVTWMLAELSFRLFEQRLSQLRARFQSASPASALPGSNGRPAAPAALLNA
jgi:peptidoglycan/LPS O-acetylase OafA/YrhL